MNSGFVVDHLCVELRKFRCDPNIDYVQLSKNMMRCMEVHYIHDLKDLREGQIAVFLCSRLTNNTANVIKLPKSVQFCLTGSVVCIAPLIRPVGLLAINQGTTTFGSAISHVFRAMMAMHKICTVNGYGKGVATVIMRAMLETGAILADEWKMIG